MIQERNFWVLLLLNIVTCGIYSYYYIYTTTRDINTMVGNDGQNTEPTTALLLCIFTCGIYTWFWYYAQGNRIKALADRNGIPCQENGTSYLMWLIFGSLLCGIGYYVGLYLFIKNLNNIIRAYNASMGGTTGPATGATV